ncbi:MAG: prolipoprotein diacylglyceryl transferase [Acidobacteria bacterium]|nr:prolipoprotein diacylglyceryl transferase [Acidobacteriota bacterium]
MVRHLADPIQQNVWAERLGGLLAPIKLHPTQIYEAAATLLIFVILLFVYRKRQFHGQVIIVYAILYAIARFIIEYWRDDPRGEFFDLSTSQFIAVVLFIGAIIAYFWRWRTTSNSRSEKRLRNRRNKRNRRKLSWCQCA